tara:strand:- start:694 stop:939 length:246 start_codon:yes stop_codon:yes gene_type:complete
LKKHSVKITWPNNISTKANVGDDWFLNAKKANLNIPTGCLSGSCGACEIDVNGKTLRPCITNIESSNKELHIEFTYDMYWN